jgi:hypothetical protein
MSEYGFVWGLGVVGDTGQKTTLNPTTMLITTFKVQVSRIGLFTTSLCRISPTGTRVEPNIHGISAILPLVSLVFHTRRQEL